MAMLWTLNLSDGAHSLLEIADRAGLDFELIRRAADELMDAGLLTIA
jgi:aminopeptidase-like protein